MHLESITVKARWYLVPFLFGQDWGISAAVTQPLALAAVLSFGRELDHGLLDGVGRPGRWLAFTTVICTLSVGLVACAVPYGVLVIAGVYLLVAFVELVGRWFVVGHFLEAGALRTARPFLLVLPAAIASALAGLASMALLAPAPALVTIAVTGVVVLAVHVVVIRLVTPATWSEILALLPCRRRPEAA